MFHAIARRRITALFEAVGRGDAAPVLAAFAGQFTHSFLGRSALAEPAIPSRRRGSGTSGSIVCCRG